MRRWEGEEEREVSGMKEKGSQEAGKRVDEMGKENGIEKGI